MLEILLILLVVLLVTVVAILAILVRNLIIKNTKYEEWFLQTYDHIVTVLEKMRELDERQMFEKDDEVGVIFGEITNLINSLGKNLENEEDEDI